MIASLLAMRPADLRPAILVVMPRTVRAVVDTLSEGLGYVRRTHVVLLAVSVVGLVSLVGMNFTIVIPAFARLRISPVIGFLMAASGLGSLAAALALAFLGRPSERVLIGGALVLGILEVALAFSRWMPLSLLCMFGIGAGGIAMAMTANTSIQLAVPDGLRGRVMAVYTTVFAGSTPIGGLLFGALAAAFGAASAVLLGGLAAIVIALVAGVVAWRWGLLGPRANEHTVAGTTAASRPPALTESSN